METIFCTITTKFRLYQCIALYNSLRRFQPGALLAVLCMDRAVSNFFEKAGLPGIMPLPLEILEDEALQGVKSGRSLSEYCWTMKPVLIEYLLKKHSEAELVVYLDSDLYFFDDPIRLLKRYKGWNVMVTTHKVNNLVNSGFLAYRRSSTTFRILEWWKNRCAAWCYGRKEGKKFGDQGHLDEMRKMFSGVCYNNEPGVNIAPWNCHNYDFTIKRGKVYVGRCRLVFFHFSGFRIRGLGSGSFTFDVDVPCELCSSYVGEIMRVLELVNGIDSELADEFCKGV